MDLSLWSTDRHMIYYQPLLPWVRLIMNDESPVFYQGVNHGISLLFPMEKLFEDYVAILLKQQLKQGYQLKTQYSGEHLIEHHNGKAWFSLRPDLVILKNKERISVLDTKWKLLDEGKSTGSDKYDLKQADIYQLFAYGKKYLAGEGHLLLIYPKHERFAHPLPVFRYDNNLYLWVVPFDLRAKRLVEGDWCDVVGWNRSLSVTI